MNDYQVNETSQVGIGKVERGHLNKLFKWRLLCYLLFSKAFLHDPYHLSAEKKTLIEEKLFFTLNGNYLKINYIFIFLHQSKKLFYFI